MCGIVGYVGNREDCVRVLIDGLEKLEYRGYDSSGIAYIKNGKVFLVKEKGNLENLKAKLTGNEKSRVGLGHTRWATNGAATRKNSHPHRVGRFTLVHNGIMENDDLIREALREKGYCFKTDTDTEVICSLLDYLYQKDSDVLQVLRKLQHIVEGSYAIGLLCDDYPDEIYCAKKKTSPLVIGLGKEENFIASDVPAILDRTNQYMILEDGDYAKITMNEVLIYHDNQKKEVEKRKFEYDREIHDKQGFPHYMLKEIHEQPEVFKQTIHSYINEDLDGLLERMPDFSKYGQIRIVACGSATHASLVGREMIQRYADVKTSVEVASEFRYGKPFLGDDELVIVISQSGETADTLEALKIAKENGNDTLGIINTKGSSIARCVDLVLYTQAGCEVAVATTKAYSAQVAMLSLIALNISSSKNLIDKKEMVTILKDIKRIPTCMEELLSREEEYEQIAEELAQHKDIYFIGRGVDYALAQEGSLKLKEISYTHSEAYPAGELKHGTISLIEEGTPVIGIATNEDIASKTINNIKEVKTRGANVLYITNRQTEENTDFYDRKIVIPKVHDLFSPLLAVIPLQMISYQVALKKGCSIDKPKNLAKSVTVE